MPTPTDDWTAFDLSRVPYILSERVLSLPDLERLRVIERLKVDPFSFSTIAVPGRPGVVDVQVGTDAFGPAIPLGRINLLAALRRDVETPAGYN